MPLPSHPRAAGCIQDCCGCMPIDCPSREAKPIDLVEAANGKQIFPIIWDTRCEGASQIIWQLRCAFSAGGKRTTV